MIILGLTKEDKIINPEKFNKKIALQCGTSDSRKTQIIKIRKFYHYKFKCKLNENVKIKRLKFYNKFIHKSKPDNNF